MHILGVVFMHLNAYSHNLCLETPKIQKETLLDILHQVVKTRKKRKERCGPVEDHICPSFDKRNKRTIRKMNHERSFS